MAGRIIGWLLLMSLLSRGFSAERGNNGGYGAVVERMLKIL